MKKFKLSYPQLNIYYADLLEENSQIFNVFGLIRIHGPIDSDIFKETIKLIHKKYPILRSKIIEKSDGPEFHVLDNYDIIYNYIDLSGFENVEHKLEQHIAGEKEYKHKILNHLLFKNVLYKISDSYYVWLFNTHHVINDGWGSSILYDEVSNIYEDLYRYGKVDIIENDTIKEYLPYEKEYLSSSRYHKDYEYWKAKLSAINPANLSNAFPGRKKSAEGKRYSLILEKDLSAKIRKLMDEKNVSGHVFFISLFYIYLSKLLRSKTISIGTAVLNRPNAAFKTTVGMFLNFIPNIVSIDESLMFTQLMSIVEKDSKNNFKHQRFPIVKLYQELSLKREDVYPFLFNFQNSVHGGTFASMPSKQDWMFNDYEEHTIALSINDRNDTGRYQLNFDFNLSVVKESNLDLHVDRYLNLLKQISEKRELRISELSILTDFEAIKIRKYLDGITQNFITKDTLSQLSSSESNHVAIIHDKASYNYDELDSSVNRFANYLISLGIKKNDTVAVITDPSFYSIVSMLALFKISAVYLPVDPAYPKERIDFIIKDSDAKLIISEEQYPEKECICIYEIPELIKGVDKKETVTQYYEDDTVYVIYTSGSTGKPKGVAIQRQEIEHYIKQFIHYFNLSKDDIVAQQASISFDTSLEEILPILSVKGKLCLLNRKKINSVSYLSEKLKSENVTLFSTSPTMISELNESGFMSDSLRIIISGGDILYDKQIYHLKKYFKVYNTYGPTEATICATYADLSDCVSHLGSPIANTSVYLLDDELNEVPLSSIGEICIAGPGLSPGYLNNAALTNEKFIFHKEIGKRLYKTGDLGRLSKDGIFEYCGRKDHQVNIHGYRIELEEIDSFINQHPSVVLAATVAVKTTEEQFLRTYIQYKSNVKFSSVEFRKYLESHLPDYMIPVSFLELDKIPLNKNGKVDRKALGKIKANEVNRSNKIALDPFEKKIGIIWSELLKKKEILLSDHFFELGGNSLIATRMLETIKSECGIISEFKDIFQYPEFKRYCDILKNKPVAENNEIPIVKNNSGIYELSRAQERLWTLDQMESDLTAYNIPVLCLIEGELSLGKFENAFNDLIKVHSSLRTRFLSTPEGPRQEIIDKLTVEVTLLDFKNKNHEELDSDIKEKLKSKIELSVLPLFHIYLYELDDNKYVFLLSIHHIITDAWSMSVFLEDFLSIYNNKQLITTKIEYKDFTLWQNDKINKSGFSESQSFWQEKLKSNQANFSIPTDFPRSGKRSYNGASESWLLSDAVKISINKILKETGSTLFMFLLACLKVLLYRYTRSELVTIGSAVSGRSHKNLDRLIGLFVNTVVINGKINSELRFRELLATTKINTMELYQHQDYPFDLIVEELGLQYDKNRNPFFDIMLVLQNATIDFPGDNSHIKLSQYNAPRAETLFDLTFNIETTNDRYEIELQYNRDLFKKETVLNLGDYYVSLIRSLCEEGIDSKILELIQINRAEKDKICRRFLNFIPSKRKESTILNDFEEIVKKYPDEIAIVSNKQSLSYQELNKISDQLANYLVNQKKIKEKDIVAIIQSRSAWMLISILAIMKTGSTYLPIDSSYPSERKKFILSDAGAKLSLTDNKNNEFFIDNDDIPFINIHEIDFSQKSFSSQSFEVDQNQNDLIYILYTSGSTGIPKGVMVKHAGFKNYIDYACKTYQCKNGMSFFTSISFDFTQTSLFLPLLSGKTVYIEEETELNEIIKKISRQSSTDIIKLTPAHVDLMNLLKIDSLFASKVIVGGDALHSHHISVLRKLNPDIEIYNEYGPTETTVGSVVHKLSENKFFREIGKPIDNTKLYILDESLQILPDGTIGEICIAGNGLALGYINQDNLTDEKFCPNPHSVDENDKLIYKTGDLGRYSSDGILEYFGRIDKQVKIRGFRIDLTEIEQAILNFQGIDDGVVLTKEDNLLAFIVTNTEISLSDLRIFLAATLVDYMIPNYFIEIEQVPLNTNGKIDQDKLLELDYKSHSINTEFVAARNKRDEELIHIWQDVLEIENVGIRDLFADLGGHSLKAVKILNQIEEKFSFKFAANELFELQTIEKISDEIALSEWLESTEKSNDSGKVITI